MHAHHAGRDHQAKSQSFAKICKHFCSLKILFDTVAPADVAFSANPASPNAVKVDCLRKSAGLQKTPANACRKGLSDLRSRLEVPCSEIYPIVEKFKTRRPFKNGEMQGNEKIQAARCI